MVCCFFPVIKSLITFVNKHLNKLNLEVTELETQVGGACFCPLLLEIRAARFYFSCVFVFAVSLLTGCTWCCWWGCWRTTLSLCTTSSSPLRALNRRWWLKKKKKNLGGQNERFVTTQNKNTFLIFCSPQVHNVAFAFELMQDGGLKKPKARPEGNLSLLFN